MNASSYGKKRIQYICFFSPQTSLHRSPSPHTISSHHLKHLRRRRNQHRNTIMRPRQVRKIQRHILRILNLRARNRNSLRLTSFRTAASGPVLTETATEPGRVTGSWFWISNLGFEEDGLGDGQTLEGFAEHEVGVLEDCGGDGSCAAEFGLVEFG